MLGVDDASDPKTACLSICPVKSDDAATLSAAVDGVPGTPPAAELLTALCMLYTLWVSVIRAKSAFITSCVVGYWTTRT